MEYPVPGVRPLGWARWRVDWGIESPRRLVGDTPSVVRALISFSGRHRSHPGSSPMSRTYLDAVIRSMASP